MLIGWRANMSSTSSGEERPWRSKTVEHILLVQYDLSCFGEFTLFNIISVVLVSLPCSIWSQAQHIQASHRKSTFSARSQSSWQNQSQPLDQNKHWSSDSWGVDSFSQTFRKTTLSRDSPTCSNLCRPAKDSQAVEETHQEEQVRLKTSTSRSSEQSKKRRSHSVNMWKVHLF